jgi:EmrB/QacA subfamily drug resistance transporter
MTLLDVSIVNVALPSIRSGLHASVSDLQWVLSGYALMFGLFLVPAGRLGDARGRRTVFLTGLSLFTLASALAGLSPGPGWLTCARLMQGAAGGLVNPQVAGFIQQLFRGAERGRAFGLLGATIGLSTAVGPLLGGAIIGLAGPAEGWRWVFYVNVPIGLTLLPVARRLLPAPHTQRAGSGGTGPAGRDLDPVGVLLLGTGVLLVLLPLIQARDWHGNAKWLLLAAALVVLAAFIGWERRYLRSGRHPVVDLGLFRVRSYALGVAIGLVYFAGFTAIFFIFTLYVQSGLGYSALLAGLAVTPFALGMAVGSALGGRAVIRLGRPMVTAGLAVVTLGLVAADVAVRLDPGHSVALATMLPLLVAGLGSGFVISPNQALSLHEVPVHGGGSAAGVLQTGQRIGSAVGIAAVGSAFFTRLATSPGDWAGSFRIGLLVALVFVILALSVALIDLVAGRRAANARA